MSKRTAAIAAVVAAMVASALLIGAEGEGQTFKSDEWGYAVRANNPLGEALFEAPARKYLLAVPMAFYKTSFETAGLDDYFPIRVLGIAMLLIAAGLFFALARRGLGDLAAVAPTVLLLFFGAAWDVVVTPLRLPALISVAAGLGMLLCLERRDQRGEVGAAVLLTVALASHPTALAFAVAAFVFIVMHPPSPGSKRPIWIVVGPVTFYAAWYLLLRDSGSGGTAELGNITEIPVFMAESFAATVAAVTGVATVGGKGVLGVDRALDDPLTWIAAGTLAIAIGFGIRVRSNSLSPLFWALLAALIALWTFTALAPRDVELRPAASGRYLYPSALLLLLLLSELVRDIRLPRAVPWIASVILALGVAYNISQVTRIANGLQIRADETRGYVSALELVRGRVEPKFLSDPFPSYSVRADQYYEFTDRFGTPALSPPELENAARASRVTADRVLAEALELRLRPDDSQPAPPGPTPVVQGEDRTGQGAKDGCVGVRPAEVGVKTVVLPPGGAWLHSDRLSEVSVNVGRFGAPTVVLVPPTTRGGALLSIPTDGAAVPWKLGISSSRPVRVCGVEAEGQTGPGP